MPPPIVTILLSVITVLIGIISFFTVRYFNKVDVIDAKLNQVLSNQAQVVETQKWLVDEVDELEKSDADIAKEQILVQIKWDLIREDWQNMKNIILLNK